MQHSGFSWAWLLVFVLFVLVGGSLALRQANLAYCFAIGLIPLLGFVLIRGVFRMIGRWLTGR